ncbi:MFS transporter [Dactylosporangium cerinum]|uniref:MFS transporter n=1 Tax=Dactylosporangium cerinum TaxID=1434730 RepID=A0ABV9W1T1_9ACTN
MPGDTGLGGRFWTLWTASTLSTLGDGIRYVAFPLLAAGLTDDPRGIALVFAAGYLPWPLFGLVGGALADRLDRRVLMWRVDLVRAVLVGAFAAAVLAQVPDIWWLAGVSLTLGVAETMFDNAATAMVPMVVGPAALDRANAWLFAAQTAASTFAGALLGALLFRIAPALPLWVDAVTFVLGAALVWTLRGRFTARHEGTPVTSLAGEIRSGLRWLVRHPALRTICLLAAAINGSVAAVEAVLVVYALDVLHIGEYGYGVLLAVLAVGGVIGSAVAPWLRGRLGDRVLITGGAAGQGVALLAGGLTSSLPVALAALAFAGLSGGAWNVVVVSLRQRIVPSELLGRVTSSYRTVGLTAMPAGAAVAGFIAHGAGLHAPMLVFGGLLVVAGFGALPWLQGLARATPVTALEGES